MLEPFLFVRRFSVMAKARALDKRRKSIRNIRKITRTMELIATARFKKAMDRAHAAAAYTQRITQLVNDLVASGLEVSHPLLAGREKTERAVLLVLSANRGLCGGYNSSVQRAAMIRYQELQQTVPAVELEVSGKRGIAGMRFRGLTATRTFTHFEDKPSFAEVDVLANRYLQAYAAGQHRSARRRLHAVRNGQPAGRRGRDVAPAGLAGLACDRGKPAVGQPGTPPPPARSDTSFCRRPRAFWPRSCRPASK